MYYVIRSYKTDTYQVLQSGLKTWAIRYGEVFFESEKKYLADEACASFNKERDKKNAAQL